MPRKELQLTEIVERTVHEDDSFPVEVAKFGVSLLDVFDVTGGWGDEDGSNSVQYTQRPLRLRPDEIVSVRDIDSRSPFHEAGAETTVWLRNGRPAHVIQPRDVVEAMRANVR